MEISILKFKNAIIRAILIILLAFFLIPIFIIVFKAVFLFSPEGVSLNANEFKNIILLSDRFIFGINNTLIYTFFITLGQTVFGILIAFLFSRFKFRFRETLFTIFILIILLPVHSNIVQTYKIVDSLNLMDSYEGVIIPQIFLPFGILFLRQYFVSIDNSILEAARIDGANNLDILFRIIIPMSKNGILLMLFLSFVDSYNMFEIPLIIIRQDALLPLSVIIRNVIENYPEQVFVPVVIYMIPPIIVFVMLRNNIVNGVMNYD